MAHDDSTKQSKLPRKTPDGANDFDDQWDDEILGEDRQTLLVIGEDDEAHDRITAVPDLPTEQYVALAMNQAELLDENEASGEAPRPDPTVAADAREAPAAQPDASLTRPGHPQTQNAECETPRAETQKVLVPLELDDLEFGLADDLDTTAAATLPPLSTDAPPPASVPSSDMSTAGAARLELQDRYAIGDFTGALALAERLLQADAGDAEAERYARSCRNVLTEMYTARLGSLHQLITVAVPPTQVRWLSLDHRAGFVLSLVDNASTVEELLDISGMPPLDTLRILTELLEQGVIVVSSG
ncbi:MAG: hypothetical protein JW940_26705 [Polyangiaceae bacterium]|nr:hypothetical protein [Polyangiaceae bacterium]